jgi:isorenieratene synthase
MQDWLESHDVDVRLSARVERIERAGEGFRAVVQGADAIAGDSVVLAVTVPALQTIVSRSPDLDDPAWRRAVAKLDVTLPFAVWRLWLDRPTAAGRQPFVGTAGLGLLDNISLYHLFQDESRAWADRTGGSVVELHAYAVPAGRTDASIRDDLWTRMLDVYPELAGARVLDERFLVRQDCPAFQPGAFADRPGVETPFEGVVLAGDFVKLPVPAALMEGAVISGFLAANELLARLSVRGEPIRSVPLCGLLRRVAPRRPTVAIHGGAR